MLEKCCKNMMFSEKAVDKIDQFLKSVFTADEFQSFKENVKQFRFLP
ncbi:MAG: hypothetical protein QXH91_04830 [Candidatus Bathyarchaeia archaeon]